MNPGVPWLHRQKFVYWAIALVEQLPGESLVKAVELLEALCSETNQVSEASPVEPNEATLLSLIQHRLPPHDQTRLAYLRYSERDGRDK